MNNSLICETCGEVLNIKHIQYYLYMKLKNTNNKKYEMNDIMLKILKINDECCKKQVMSKKMNKNMHIFINEKNEYAKTIFKIKNI